MTFLQCQDAAHELAWKARALYLTAMGADIPKHPDLDAIRSLALEVCGLAEAHADAIHESTANPLPSHA